MNWDNVYDYYIWSLLPALLFLCWGIYSDLKCLYGFDTPDHKFGYCLTDTVLFLPTLGLLCVPGVNILAWIAAVALAIFNLFNHFLHR